MNKKRVSEEDLNLLLLNNIYGLGDFMQKNSSGIAGAVGTAADLITDAVNTGKGLDTSKYTEEARTFGNEAINAQNNEDFLEAWNRNYQLSNIDKYDITGGSKTSDFLGGLTGALGATAKGAAAGASIDPVYGTIIGAGVGLASNLTGQFFGAKNTKKNLAITNNAINVANNRRLASLDNAAYNVYNQNMANTLMNFAAFGGPIDTTFSNGVIFINEGGTHENNPHQGVQMGIAPDGKPNLVEEGEAIFKDFVFSNRLRVPKAVRTKYKLGGQKPLTFAEAFRKAQLESQERANDPISQNGLDNIAMILARTQEAIKQRGNMRNSHMAALGGYKYDGESPTYDWTSFLRDALIKNSGYAASNGNTYLPYRRGLTKEQVKNGIEGADGYSAFTDYVYNNWDNPQVQNYLKQLDILTGRNNIGNGRDYFRKARTDSVEGYYHLTPTLMAAAPTVAAPAASVAAATPRGDVEASEPDVDNVIESFWKNTLGDNDSPENRIAHMRGTTPQEKDYNLRLSPLRYMDAAANVGAVASDMLGLTNTPTVFNQISPFTPITFKPVGNYIAPTYFDTRYAANQASQQAAATREAIMQSSSPSRWANLLAADYNAQIANGELLRQAALDNYDRAVKREEFNRGTNQMNSQMGLQTAATNQAAKMRYDQAMLQQAKWNDDAANLASSARAQNLGSLAESIANIGREQDAKDWTNLLIKSGAFGTLPAACGGKIRKRRKGLTY